MKTKMFRWVAGFAGVYHAILGLLGTFASQDMVQTAVNFVYGVNLEITGQVVYLIKFTSAYMVAFAVAMLLLAWRPVQYVNLIWVAAGLFGMRLLDRIIFFQGLREEFGFALAQEAITVAIISVILILLFTLRPKGSQ